MLTGRESQHSEASVMTVLLILRKMLAVSIAVRHILLDCDG